MGIIIIVVIRGAAEMINGFNKYHQDEYNVGRAAESESRPELELVGVDRFGRSLSRSWSG